MLRNLLLFRMNAHDSASLVWSGPPNSANSFYAHSHSSGSSNETRKSTQCHPVNTSKKALSMLVVVETDDIVL